MGLFMAETLAVAMDMGPAPGEPNINGDKDQNSRRDNRCGSGYLRYIYIPNPIYASNFERVALFPI
jgi:hypothetical protein